MANVLLLNAYDSLISDRTHKLPVTLMCQMLGWDESNNIERLRDALRKLTSTTVEFNVMEDGKDEWQVMSMLSFGGIKGGVCTYRYDEALAERLFDPEVYATINIGMQRRFEGGYALTLYENCLRYKNVGSTGWLDLARFRKLVGATAPMYDEFKYLKRDVISKPVDEINRVSDILLEPEYDKNGRRVTKVRFLIRENPQHSLFKPGVTDEHEAIRETKTYQRLREHGIGERLAIAWVLQDEEHASAVVDYVEAKDRKRQVKGPTAGYIRTLIEEHADVGKPAYEVAKEKKERSATKDDQAERAQLQRKELEADYRRERTAAAVKALTPDQRHDYVVRYQQALGPELTASYSDTKMEFKDSVERAKFLTWLRQSLAAKDIDPQKFEEWIAAKAAANKRT